MRPARALAVAALALFSACAWGEAPPKDIFKGRIKEGLYETRTEIDMSAVPGVAKGAQKQTQTQQRCVTRAEIDKGMSSDKNCPITTHKVAGNVVEFGADCTDGSKTSMRMTFGATGYEAEMKSVGSKGGKPYQSMIRSQSRYLGACKK